MKTNSNPREWYQQEELARDRARRKMRDGGSSSLTPMYVAAALIAVGVLYLLILLAER